MQYGILLYITAHFCSYPWYLKHWEQFQMDNPDCPILDLFYEDLKKVWFLFKKYLYFPFCTLAHLQETTFENIMTKEEIAHNSNVARKFFN